ncbi:hypothetical protein [Streptomyces sp. NPDC020141]|uniref:hypothetical protein n=1 Tax=Streptomyces sp. NPDC020141 TaxID=3365065 RepID=UPI0037B3C678
MSAVSGGAMQPRVVYVHGIGNKIRAESLKRQWDTALFGRDMAEVSRMAYWAPLRHPAPLPDGSPEFPADGPEIDEGIPAPGRAESADAFIARVLGEARARNAAGGIPPEGRGAGGGADPAGPEGADGALGGWLREMTFLADTLAGADVPVLTDTPVLADASAPASHPAGGDAPAGVKGGPAGAEDAPARAEGGPAECGQEALPLPGPVRRTVFRLLVERTFKDVHAYFFGGVGEAMRAVVREALQGLEGSRVAVVGHSLGSVIAYEVLAGRESEVELFCTVGSPLAVTEFQELLTGPPAVPACVRSWRNASDLRDLVALDHTLRPDFRPVERITDLLVTNSSGNHHGIVEYLKNRRVGEPIRALTAGIAEE